jgi:hypothetical protein
LEDYDWNDRLRPKPRFHQQKVRNHIVEYKMRRQDKIPEIDQIRYLELKMMYNMVILVVECITMRVVVLLGREKWWNSGSWSVSDGDVADAQKSVETEKE